MDGNGGATASSGPAVALLAGGDALVVLGYGVWLGSFREMRGG